MPYVAKFGEAKACCDRCGFDFRLPQLRLEWDGLKVCSECWESRNAQDFVRGVPDWQAVRDPRPEPAPVFIPDAPGTGPSLDFSKAKNSQYLILGII